MDNYDFGLKGANVKILGKTIDNMIKSNKCNQCDFASSQAGDLRRHLKTHGGEKGDGEKKGGGVNLVNRVRNQF